MEFNQLEFFLMNKYWKKLSNRFENIDRKLASIEASIRIMILTQNSDENAIQAAFTKLTAAIQQQTAAIQAENTQITTSLAQITTLVGTLENPDTTAIVAQINDAIDQITASANTVSTATTNLAAATTTIIQVPEPPPAPPPPPPPATVSPTDTDTLG